jgi:hypothetical protein
VCDLETSRIDAPYIYDISNLRVKTALKVRRLKLLENVVNAGGTGPEKKILKGKPGCRMETGRQILRGGGDFKQ